MPGMTIQKVEKVEIHGFSIPRTISLEKKVIYDSVDDIKDEKNEEMSFIPDFFLLK
jgi:hypothetical protein